MSDILDRDPFDDHDQFCWQCADRERITINTQSERNRMLAVVEAALKVVEYAEDTGDGNRCIEAIHPVGKCVDCDFLRAVKEYKR